MISKEFNSVLDLLKKFKDEQTCIEHLEGIRWREGVVSPFDPRSKIYKCKDNRYHCQNTNKYFNVKTGTLFDNSKVPLQKWFLAIYLLTSSKKGISSLGLSRELGTTQKTAWFMAHRIRNCFGIDDDTELDGTVESDETFVGGKNKNRHKDKKVEQSQGRSFKDKTPILGLMERQEIELTERPHKLVPDKIVIEPLILKPSFVVCRVVPDTKLKTIQPILKSFVKNNTKLVTDEWHAYQGLSSNYDHYIVNHAAKEYVNNEDSSIHSNTIEGFWSIVKRGIIGIYHYASRKHLQKYADEFAFRYNTKDISTTDRINLFFHNFENRLTYKILTQCKQV